MIKQADGLNYFDIAYLDEDFALSSHDKLILKHLTVKIGFASNRVYPAVSKEGICRA